MNQYEMMLLFDPAFASEFQKAKQEVERILTRAEAEVVFLEKWDERKLAYEIKGRKRGCYVLTFFKCDPTKVVGIERDARLSETILRVLIKRADDLSPENMNMLLPQNRAAEDSGSDDDYRRDDYRRDDYRRDDYRRDDNRRDDNRRDESRVPPERRVSAGDDNEPEPAIAGESDD